MKRGLKRGIRIAWYAAYGAALALVFLSLRFPSESYLEHLRSRVRETAPGLRMDARTVRPLFPLGLKLLSPRLEGDDRPGAVLFAASELRVTRTVSSLLQGTYTYAFEADAYDGRLAGTADWRNGGPDAPVALQVRLADVSVGKHEYLQRLAGHSVSGKVEGKAYFTGRRDQWMDGRAEADLILRGGRITLAKPIWNVDTFHIDEAGGVLQLRDRQLRLIRFDVLGRELQARLSGTVLLKERLEDSRLNLKGTVRPFPALSNVLGGLLGGVLPTRFRQGVSFIIHGTLAEPDIQVL